MTDPPLPADQPKRRGRLKTGLIAIVAIIGVIILVAILVTAISGGAEDGAREDAALGDETQPTSIDGIAVPASAERDGDASGPELFNVQGAEFEEVSEWMGERLPDDVDGLDACFAGRISDVMHQWAWTNGEPGEWADHVVVTVGSTDEPGQIVVSRGEDLVDCNLR